MDTKKNAPRTIDTFIEKDASKQKELEEQLQNAELEKLLSPFYLFQNVNATFVGL